MGLSKGPYILTSAYGICDILNTMAPKFYVFECLGPSW